MILTLLIGPLQPAENGTIVSERHTLTVPNEIASEVFPYLECMLEDGGGRLRDSRNGLSGHAALELLKSDCRPERESAEVRARKKLTDSYPEFSDSERMITTTLISIDHAQDSVAERLDRTKPTQTDTSTPNGVRE